MPDERLPKKVFYGELQVGKRSQDDHKQRYKHTKKVSLKDFNIPPSESVAFIIHLVQQYTLLNLAQLRLTGHFTRLPDERLPKKVCYGELQVGKRSQDDHKQRYKHTKKVSLKDFNIPPSESVDFIIHLVQQYTLLSILC